MSQSKYEFHRNLAVIIGINNYSNGIPELETPIDDAKELAKILQENYQYEVQILLNEKAKLQELNSLLDDFKQKTLYLPDKTLQIEKNDRLIFYFAGHGIVPTDGLENTDNLGGYLVPQDARGDILLQKQIEIDKILLPMQKLHDALTELPCRHLLVILDCCFAGAFRSSLYREIVPARKVYKQRYDRFIRYPAWQAIASAAHDQKALDYLGCFGQRGTIEDNKHSPFAEALFEGLRGAADTTLREGDGIITATELYCYVRDRVEELTDEQNRRQTPGLFPLKKHDKGEYIFLLPSFDQDKLEDAPALNEENNPYRGLKSYEEEHSPLFFGRDELVKQLYDRVCKPENLLTVVLGVSGSGKSSLVKAGLIPYLRANHPEEWHIIPTLRPGESPFAALAEAIVENSETSRSKIDTIKFLSKSLKQVPRQFINVIANWRQIPTNARILLVIDQFEELITTCKQQEREWFLNFLGETLTAHSQQLCLVLTLRSDFEPRFLDSALKAYWMNARFPVRAMRADELRQAIERPALEKMLDFEPPNLVDKLIDEVGQMPGALSLLSFTLSELYIKCIEADRGNRSLTEADYKDLGGVAGSLTHRATDIYDKLNQAQQATMQRVMLRMVTIEGGELARRRVPLSELEYMDDAENKRVQKILQRLDTSRLIVGGRETGGEPYVEPAHDALVQGWLLVWKNEVDLILQRRLTSDAKNWNANNRNENFLWNNNPRLNLLQEIFNSDNNWLNKIETEFLKYSLKERERSDIENLKAKAKEQLQNNNQLEALSTALKAGKKLQHFLSTPYIKLKIDARIEKELRQIICGIQECNRLEEHEHWLWCVNFSPDGQKIASACRDGIVKIWSRDGKKLGDDIKACENKDAEATYVCFSPDGETIATASTDRFVRFWSSEGKQKQVLLSHESEVWCINFSRDGQKIASGCKDGTVKIWSLNDEDPSFIYIKAPKKDKAHENEVHSLTFSPDGQWLATAGFDGKVKLWSIQGTFKREFIGNNINGFNSVTFSPDSQLIAAACDDKTIKLWHVARTEGGKIFEGHKDWVKSVSFSPNGQLIASGSADNTIKLWSIEGEELKTLKGHQNEIWSVCFSPDGQTLASASWDHTVKIWSSKVDQRKVIKGHKQAISSVNFSPKDKVFATGSWDKEVKFWTYSGNGKNFPILNCHEAVRCISFSPNGQTIASGCQDGTIKIWSLNGTKPSSIYIKEPQEDKAHKLVVTSVSFSRDGKTLASASEDTTVKLWDLNSLNHDKPQLKFTFEDHTEHLTSVSFSPDGKNIASACWGGFVYLWSISEGKEQKPKIIAKHDDAVMSISFSPDGKTLATASRDRTAKLWDVNGKFNSPLATLKGHMGHLTCVSFSPDGKIIATTSRDGTVKLWSSDGAELKTLEGHYVAVSSVSFSPNNDLSEVLIVSTGEDGKLILWNLDNQELLELKDLNLDNLLKKAEQWLYNYMMNRQEKELKKKIFKQQKKGIFQQRSQF